SVVALHHAGEGAQAAHVATRLLALTEPEGYLRLYLNRGEPMRQALSALLEMVGKETPDVPQEEESTIAAISISRSYVSRLLAAFEQEERRRAHRSGKPLADHPEIQPELTPAEGQQKR